MPSKKPLSQNDLDVGKRIYEFRRLMHLSREDMARYLGCHRDRLTRIELGKAALKYETAFNMAIWLRLNLEWLGAGIGNPLGGLPPPHTTDLGETENSRFYDVFEKHFLPALRSAAKTYEASKGPISRTPAKFQEAALRVRSSDALSAQIEKRLQSLPAESLGEAVRKIDDAQKKAGAQFPSVSPQERLEVVALMSKIRERLKKGDKQELTVFPQRGSFFEVKKLLPDTIEALMGRAARLVAKRTQKAAALEIGVTPQKLNDWLNGRRAPGGQAALRLLNWVVEEEVKQESPANVEATGGARTQRKVSKHENRTSSPGES